MKINNINEVKRISTGENNNNFLIQLIDNQNF
jgi:hypothetical protein